MKTQTRSGPYKDPAPRPIPGHAPAGWAFLKEEARQLGFCAVGVAPARAVPSEAQDIFDDWLRRGQHADMVYMERWTDRRKDPRQEGIMPGAVAVISAALPYCDGSTDRGIWRHVARHARGRDYHSTVRDRLESLAESIHRNFPKMRYRVFVDTAPVMERTWALLAGLGEIGRSGALLVHDFGPMAVLGEIVCTGVSTPDPATPAIAESSMCKDCRVCIDSCPTGALGQDGLVDSSRCLSYQTIENRSLPVPREVRSKVELIFGCDRCTSTCPARRPWEAGSSLEYLPSPEGDSLTLAQIGDMDLAALERLISGTPLERTGPSKIKTNAAAAANSRQEHRQ